MQADDVPARCRDNLAAVRSRIDEACRRAGREPAAVRLVAVTKYVDDALTRAIAMAGCLDLAESRPQALWSKAAALGGLAPPVRWHLIGHLQRNKVQRTLAVVDLVHTLDSLRLLAAIDAEAAAQSRRAAVLVEVNLAGAEARTGATEADARAIVAAAMASCPHVEIRGLMGMASVPDGPDAEGRARRQFGHLRQLRDQLRAETGLPLAELSMGMSGDYVEAILEGATMVRIGSALFAGFI
jgi:pyridoxal phosphate enzyme (YggS family)